MPVAVVFAGGDPPGPASIEDVGPSPLVIAADSGLHHAAACGVTVDVLIGDLDSVDPALAAKAEEAGTTVLRHPSAKDQTDLELAIAHAVEAGASRVVVVGGGGGRLDHLLANALLLASPRFAAAEIEARAGTARSHVVRRATTLRGAPGELVTLLALGGPARGVTTDGLLYPLRDEELLPGSSRGVSNELVGAVATVSLAAGVLLAVLPGESGTHQAE